MVAAGSVDSLSKTEVSQMTTPYMTEPALLESLQGQQYVVLRPSESFAAFLRERAARDRGAAARGDTPPEHFAFRSFFEPGRVRSFRELIASWAGAQSSVELRVDAVDEFPPPFQELITRL